MVAYAYVSISQELTPNQLQAGLFISFLFQSFHVQIWKCSDGRISYLCLPALCKTFSGKKKKSRLRKAWDGSKVIYNVASWSATAIG